MFDSLIDRLEKVKRKIFGYGRITPKELTEFLQDLRISLLEADVNYRVVKDFIAKIEDRAQGVQLNQAIAPADVLFKIVYEELVAMLGGTIKNLEFTHKKLNIVSLVGLQGTGKTTTAVKLAYRFKSWQPLLVAADTKRPAAREQLKSLALKANIAVFDSNELDPIKICQSARTHAIEQDIGLVIIDTAGRLHVDDELIQELTSINQTLRPEWQIIVVDGMTGQDAINQTKEFHSRIGLTGAILTKLDGDAKGGAALSIVSVASVPILFIGIGEKINALEEFHPDRIASRLLGMGDVKTLTEKIGSLDVPGEEKKIKKFQKGEFDLEDFRLQLQQIKKLGPIANLASMIPGIKTDDINEQEMIKIEAITNSMTKGERAHPEIIDGSRKKRIALGSGTSVQDVNLLLKQFFLTKEMLQKISKGKTPPVINLGKKTKVKKIIRK